MWLFVLVVSVFAIHDTLSQLQDVCANARMRHGVGYNHHPYDCSMFVQCVSRGSRVERHPIYRKCDFGEFWDQTTLRCLPSYLVDCPHDKCRKRGTKFYKHLDPNKCGAFWKCDKGKAYPNCCPLEHGFHVTKGCIPMKTCKSMCPLRDRVIGCGRRPISGAPTQFEQYIDNGLWKKDKCPPGNAYNPTDCSCSITGVIKAGRSCKPDLVLTFDDGRIRDTSGKNNRVRSQRVAVRNGQAYFAGNSRIVIDPLKPSEYDEGVLIIKMKYSDYEKNGGKSQALQAMLTNGHCSRAPASVLIAKHREYILMGAEAKRKSMKKPNSNSFWLPTVAQPKKEVIYIKDDYKLEGRVCGASFNKWATGKLVDTGCGFQIGKAKRFQGYFGSIDEIYIYRCKPLDAVINMKY